MSTHALDEVRNPAEIYDARFVPALFAQWGPVVAAEAGVRKGDRVLDVACGTGALTLAVSEIVGPAGAEVHCAGTKVEPDYQAGGPMPLARCREVAHRLRREWRGVSGRDQYHDRDRERQGAGVHRPGAGGAGVPGRFTEGTP